MSIVNFNRRDVYLFHSELFSQLDVKDPLIQLANTINWTVFDDAFEQHYYSVALQGIPGIPGI
jgi:hypothetical protein